MNRELAQILVSLTIFSLTYKPQGCNNDRPFVQDDLTQGRSTYKQWDGILGTLPSYKNENDDPELDKYMLFKKAYESKFNNTRRMKQYDLNKHVSVDYFG